MGLSLLLLPSLPPTLLPLQYPAPLLLPLPLPLRPGAEVPGGASQRQSRRCPSGRCLPPLLPAAACLPNQPLLLPLLTC